MFSGPFWRFTTGLGVARALHKHRVTEVDMGANRFQVFSKGEIGRMHVVVHRLTDERRYELGHRFLGDWLDGTSSESTHSKA
jgi:hypothetical protein